MAKSKRGATRRGEKPKGNLWASSGASLEELTRAKPQTPVATHQGFTAK